jgi:hypothetical protein
LYFSNNSTFENIMKKSIFLLWLLGVFVSSSCTHHHHHGSNSAGLPPGQAKKVTGSQSAKPYAPGQQKKH